MKDFNSGIAIWNQRFKLKQAKLRLKQLADAVGHISDSSLAQYAQMFAITLEFTPDLIVEFGRGAGNSTAVFTEAANQLGNCSVISICLSNDWQNQTSGRIAKIVPDSWFDKLDAQIANILDIQFKRLIKDKKKILFLWDAHGWDIAEYTLAKVLPILASRQHLVLVHDISYFDPNSQNAPYRRAKMWKGQSVNDEKNPPYLVLGSMESPFDELIALYDFASRNNIKIHSVQEEINKTFQKNKSISEEIKRLIGEEMGNSSSSFHWFSLNSLPKQKKIHFPRYQRTYQQNQSAISLSSDNKKFQTSQFINSRPLVSIVTPSFNSGGFIKECIESVLFQDYHRLEHVIQDAASKDNTVDIIKRYDQKFKNRIKWVSEPDNGQSDGLDKALKRAKGEVILVLNADDVLLPYACSWGVLHLKMNPDVAVVYGDEYIIDETGKIIHEFTGPRYDYEKLLCVEIVPAAQTAFIRRSYFEQVGLGADSSLETCPDYEMWVRIGARFPMKYSPGFISKYRWHTGSEGQQPSMILKMVEAKKQVMDRVFNDKKTPKRIKKLRKRAYAGVEMWGAINNMQLRGPVPITAKLVISSFLNYPPNIAKYRKLIPGGILSFSRFALKSYGKKFLK